MTIRDTTTSSGEASVVFPNAPSSLRGEPSSQQVTLHWSEVTTARGWEVQQDGGA